MSQLRTQPQGPQAVGSTTVVIIAIIMSLVAVIITNVYIMQIRRQTSEQSFVVYRIKQPVRAGDKLIKDLVDEVRVPASFLESMKRLQCLTTTDLETELQNKKQFVRPAQQNDLLRWELFRLDASAQEASANVEEGKRLVTLPVNSRNQPPLAPRSYVDLAGAFSIKGKFTVLPVIECIQLVQVGPYTRADEAGKGVTNYSTIGIAMPPRAADQLSLLQKTMVGEFEVRVRNPNDQKLIYNFKGGPGAINDELLKMLEAGVTTGRNLGRGTNLEVPNQP